MAVGGRMHGVDVCDVGLDTNERVIKSETLRLDKKRNYKSFAVLILI